MTTPQKISAAILEKIAAGMPVKDAFDAVLGAGAYDRLAFDLYETLRRNLAQPMERTNAPTLH